MSRHRFTNKILFNDLFVKNSDKNLKGKPTKGRIQALTAKRCGAPEDKIFISDNGTNTGENIADINNYWKKHSGKIMFPSFTKFG